MDGSAGDADLRALKTELKKAEAALKRSKTKDYYKILGVARDCTEQEVRKAYRRESLKHHPDKVRYLAFLFFEEKNLTAINRAATRKSSSSSWKQTRCSQTRSEGSAMTWARTRTG